MELTLSFLINSIGFGVGLAMDAFSVSLANGLNEPKMKLPKIFFIAGIFAFFQALMPILGWVCMHTVVVYFRAFEKFIPWIALVLLLYIGLKMLIDGIKDSDCECDCGKKLTLWLLAVQGIATSIDALSVGITNASYGFSEEIISSLIIAVVTFFICVVGVYIGKKFGTQLAGKASILGGAILIFIGIKVFIDGDGHMQIIDLIKNI